MLTQKLYKNGNSVAVTIPKEYLNDLNLRDGSQVVVEKDPNTQTIIISKKTSRVQSSITPKFLNWLESFNKQYGPALKELANR